MNVRWNPITSDYITPLSRKDGWGNIISSPPNNLLKNRGDLTTGNYPRYVEVLGRLRQKLEPNHQTEISRPKPFNFLIERSKVLFGENNPITDALGTFRIFSEEDFTRGVGDASKLIARDLDILVQTGKKEEYIKYVNYLIDVALCTEYLQNAGKQLKNLIGMFENLAAKLDANSKSENLGIEDVADALEDLGNVKDATEEVMDPLIKQAPDNYSLGAAVMTLSAVASFPEKNLPSSDLGKLRKKAEEVVISIAKKHLSDSARAMAIIAISNINTRECISALKEVVKSEEDVRLKQLAEVMLKDNQKQRIEYLKSIPQRIKKRSLQLIYRGLAKAIKFIFRL